VLTAVDSLKGRGNLELPDTDRREIFMGLKGVDSKYFNYFNSPRIGPKAKSFEYYYGTFI
jgi:hypothetical protein